MLGRIGSRALAAWTGAVLVFVYVPLATVLLYAFNSSRTVRWPIDGVSGKWFDKAFHNEGFWGALGMSVKVGLVATSIALILGSCAAFAVHRFRFFGRNAVSFLILIPISLPGIVTGIALNSTFSNQGILGGVPLGLMTIVVGHATFCIVTVYNNVLARLRRVGGSIEEASADLGASGWQTFRFVVFPQIRSALLAGGLLAFALSFDEIIVTKFTVGGDPTLPLWIESNFSRPNQGPITYAVACIAVVLSIVPAWLAQRLTDSDRGG